MKASTVTLPFVTARDIEKAAEFLAALRRPFNAYIDTGHIIIDMLD